MTGRETDRYGNAGGVPSRPGLRPDRYKSLTAWAVMLVAAIAAAVSYIHIYALAVRYGQPVMAAWLLPLSIDGTVAVSSLAMLRAARASVSSPWLARGMLLLAVGATLACNVGYGVSHGWPGALLSGWPAVAFVGCAEVAISMSRRTAPKTAPLASPRSVPASASSGPSVSAPPVAQGRSGARPRRRSGADTEAAALTALSANPDLNGSQLGRQLGVSERTGRRLLGQLAGRP